MNPFERHIFNQRGPSLVTTALFAFTGAWKSRENIYDIAKRGIGYCLCGLEKPDRGGALILYAIEGHLLNLNRRFLLYPLLGQAG